jgi:transcriptional regulator with XRE-family HTH domain
MTSTKKDGSPSKFSQPGDRLKGRVTRGHKNPLWYQLPERIADLRKRLGLTVRAVGAATAISHSVVVEYENGKRTPALDTTEKLAAAFGVPACWLAFGELGEECFAQKRASATPVPAAPLPVAGGLPYLALNAGCASRLRGLREGRGLSYRDLGKAAGVSYETIRKTETRETSPKLDAVWRLAVALDVAPCWLAYGVGQGPAD